MIVKIWRFEKLEKRNWLINQDEIKVRDNIQNYKKKLEIRKENFCMYKKVKK